MFLLWRQFRLSPSNHSEHSYYELLSGSWRIVGLVPFHNFCCCKKYAVEYLKVKHIIVCGHYDCGAVKAASTAMNHNAPLENWLTSIRDVKRRYLQELTKIAEEDARRRRLVELNVIERLLNMGFWVLSQTAFKASIILHFALSCLNVFKTGIVQKRRAETLTKPEQYPFIMPRVHAVVFDPAVGRLKVSSLLDTRSKISYRKTR